MMTDMSEFVNVAKAMNDAGYLGVTPNLVEKSHNEYGIILYIAVIGDFMVIYTPEYEEPFKKVWL